MLRGCVNEKTSQKARTIGCTLKHNTENKISEVGWYEFDQHRRIQKEENKHVSVNVQSRASIKADYSGEWREAMFLALEGSMFLILQCKTYKTNITLRVQIEKQKIQA